MRSRQPIANPTSSVSSCRIQAELYVHSFKKHARAGAAGWLRWCPAPFRRVRRLATAWGGGQARIIWLGGRAAEDRHFQHQQHQQAPGQPDRLAQKGAARSCLPPGAKGRAAGISHERSSCPRLSRSLAWRTFLERRSDPRAGLRPGADRASLPRNADDHQARYIEAAVNGVLIASIYLPNGNPQPGPKFDYKLAWFERLIEHAAELRNAGVPVVLAGDYNVVPAAQDIYPTRSLDKNALIQPESRQAYARLLAQGWTDALRKLEPEGPLWTFWDYEHNRWPLDKGMRLDHLLLSAAARDRLVDGGVDRWVRGEENASDHAPAWIELST
ncbi:MAG: Exodeoxyribonuclease [Bryobacterales bacterium]|nr:Exodeoxyribonuclease [Bryobacterales bacterium]